MGVIKFRGQIIYTGLAGKVDVRENWSNDMQTSWPEIHIKTVSADEPWSVLNRTISLGVEWSKNEAMSHLEVILDQDQVALINQIENARAEQRRLEMEREEVRVGKNVRVVRGRKYPIGTEGRVFWVGANKFGTSAGIEQPNGKRIFVAIQNLEVVGGSNK